jgi:hypothetical protein
MATIGLNDGPFLVMTITFEKGALTIADPIENKVPTITLTQADSIALAESFPSIYAWDSEKTSITFKVHTYGCEYVISVFREGDVMAMEIYNKAYAVKALFTADAKEYFEWVLNEITSHNSHVVLD